MRTIFSIFFLAAWVLAHYGCGGTPGASTQAGNPQAGKVEPINVVVVLDLSNRLVKTPGQADKDQAIIQSALKIFDERQKRQAYITSNDLLRLVVAPQPDVPTSANDSMRIDMGEKRAKVGNKSLMGLPKFKAERERFERSLSRLYEQALAQPFTGADLYTFFCTELPRNFADPNRKTKVLVLTDGYLEFDRAYLSRRPDCTYMRELDKMRREKDNWKGRFDKKKLGLCPCPAQQFSNTEVLFLETAPLFKGASVYEFPIIEHYWTTWFDSMALPASIEPYDAMVSGIEDKIRTFLQ